MRLVHVLEPLFVSDLFGLHVKELFRVVLESARDNNNDNICDALFLKILYL